MSETKPRTGEYIKTSYGWIHRIYTDVPVTVKVCLVCDKQFFSDERRSEAMYCSVKCARKIGQRKYVARKKEK